MYIYIYIYIPVLPVGEGAHPEGGVVLRSTHNQSYVSKGI